MADGFRQEIIDREQHAGTLMLHAYGRAWLSLKGQLEQTLREIQERRDAGQDVSVGWLRALERVKSLKAQAEGEIARFAQFATESTKSEQSAAVHAAQVHTAALIQTQAPGVSVQFDRLHTRAIEHLVGFGTDGAPLRELFEQIAPGTADAAIQQLVTGAVIGLPVAQIAERLRDELGTGLSRALTIARTETLRAYRMSSIDSYQASPLVDAWYWRSYPSACGVCQAMSGTFHPVTEHFYSHPRCRCAPIPVVKGAGLKVESGPERFAALPAAKQREILGPAKFKLYRNKRIRLEDLVEHTHSERWGPGLQEANIKQALENAKRAGGP